MALFCNAPNCGIFKDIYIYIMIAKIVVYVAEENDFDKVLSLGFSIFFFAALAHEQVCH